MSELKLIAQRILGLLDLTSLNDDDNEQVIKSLCERAVTPFGPVAAVCVWPQFVAQAVAQLRDTSVRVAAVANFPEGSPDISQAVATTKEIIESGADEVDVVFPYQTFLSGDTVTSAQLVKQCKDACGDGKKLKVILETGCLADSGAIRQASSLVLEQGADFIKTSTGKVPVSATPEAARDMLETLHKFNFPAGLKVSGGIKDVATASVYLALADEIMGDKWVCPDTFRFGASGILDNLLSVLRGEDNTPPSSSGY